MTHLRRFAPTAPAEWSWNGWPNAGGIAGRMLVEQVAEWRGMRINIQNIGIRDVDAVDCDFRQPKQARELTLVNRPRSIELKTFEWMYTEVGLVKN
ncbi:hypothetical protein [Thiocapsa marina]|uniref:Uncharacterized protein n=1 Tax=Thiocapsa marina 5811 TaxID=768671 RepID=F9UIW0_9GAMM|nr:hypothetical protein [Thiocapsa marina]EGV15854.1 hypothetical protein ThimaDRAFT_4863 [Thiocapsa marina 5811]